MSQSLGNRENRKNRENREHRKNRSYPLPVTPVFVVVNTLLEFYAIQNLPPCPLGTSGVSLMPCLSACCLSGRLFLLGDRRGSAQIPRVTSDPSKVNAIYCISSTLGGQRTEVYPLGRRWGSKGQPRERPGGPRGGASGSQERPLGVQGASKRAPEVPKESPGASRGGPNEPRGCPKQVQGEVQRQGKWIRRARLEACR